MKPYGNEHTYQIEALTSTKHFPNRDSKFRRAIKAAYRARRRANDKQALRKLIRTGE